MQQFTISYKHICFSAITFLERLHLTNEREENTNKCRGKQHHCVILLNTDEPCDAVKNQSAANEEENIAAEVNHREQKPLMNRCRDHNHCSVDKLMYQVNISLYSKYDRCHTVLEESHL